MRIKFVQQLNLLFALLICLSLLIQVKSLTKISLDHHQQKSSDQNRQKWTELQWTWYNTEYLLDQAPSIPNNYSITKQQWKIRYGQFFHTPEWLTQQKFQFCDWNGNNIIQASQVKCF